MAFHRNNNGHNNRYNNNRQNFRPRHNNQHQGQQGGQRRHVNRINQVFESTGPDGRVRGTAQQLVEKYSGLARDAQASGDSVLMLNYFQHAEHYQRLYTEIQEENAIFEREREAQRAQYQPAPQPVLDGDMNAPAPAAADAVPGVDMPPAAPAPEAISSNTAPSDAGARTTGGRVMGRRPAAPRDDRNPNAGSGQMQDDHMPSFLKKDIPIKAAAPAAPAEGDTGAEPAAAFGKRRAPARRTTTADDGADS